MICFYFIYILNLLNSNLVELSGIEPLTSCVQGRRSPSWAIAPKKVILIKLVGLGGLEPPTSPLSGVRSNQAELQTQNITTNKYIKISFAYIQTS